MFYKEEEIWLPLHRKDKLNQKLPENLFSYPIGQSAFISVSVSGSEDRDRSILELK